MIIGRYLQNQLHSYRGRGKILIIYGPRQVGKTTLVKTFLSPEALYLNCDIGTSRRLLETDNLSHLTSLLADHNLIVIDEAQRVHNIGLTLKILIDHFRHKDFIVTGSSALELADSIAEPLTGRYFSFQLYPLSIDELKPTTDPITLREQISDRLIYGSYPEIITTIPTNIRIQLLKNIVDSYLLKDILEFGIVKEPAMLIRLLRAVALQIGKEVSYDELANLLDMSKQTVRRYLDLLEQIFILVSLPPYLANKRQAVRKKCKYFFLDLGVRNALLDDFKPLELRADVGDLWENFCIMERIKRNAMIGLSRRYYFWRAYHGQEIDLLEEGGGQLNGFEIKYSKDKTSLGAKRAFAEMIGAKDLVVVNKDNLFETLLPPISSSHQ